MDGDIYMKSGWTPLEVHNIYNIYNNICNNNNINNIYTNNNKHKEVYKLLNYEWREWKHKLL
jgi:hypothetical protein